MATLSLSLILSASSFAGCAPKKPILVDDSLQILSLESFRNEDGMVVTRILRKGSDGRVESVPAEDQPKLNGFYVVSNGLFRDMVLGMVKYDPDLSYRILDAMP